MPSSNFPLGFEAGVNIRGVNIFQTQTGKVFYVNNSTTVKGDISSGGSDAGKGSYLRPFATIDYAIGRCQAGRGDIVALMPGHAETISAAGGIAQDVAGVAIVGLGKGRLRPVISFSDTASTWTISGAGCTVANIVALTTVDLVVSKFVVSAADCVLDIECRDTSATVEAVIDVLTTAAADRLQIDLKHIGFTAGDGTDSCIRLVGCDTADINVDFYGDLTDAVVEMHTTAGTNVEVDGRFYVNGTSDFSLTVVDTVGGSTWSARGWDGVANSSFSGGNGTALAGDDISALTAAVAVIDGYHDVATADAATNAVMSDVIGNKTDAAAAGAVSAVESLMAYAKQNVTAAIASVSAQGTMLRTLVKTDGAVLNGKDPLFTITGGSIHVVSVIGTVTTVIGGAANGTLQADVTTPSATVGMSTTVAIDNDGEGAVYTFVGPTGILTPTDAGLVLIDQGSTTLTETQYVVPIGNINFLGSAAQSGVISWTLTYYANDEATVVVAA